MISIKSGLFKHEIYTTFVVIAPIFDLESERNYNSLNMSPLFNNFILLFIPVSYVLAYSLIFPLIKKYTRSDFVFLS